MVTDGRLQGPARTLVAIVAGGDLRVDRRRRWRERVHRTLVDLSDSKHEAPCYIARMISYAQRVCFDREHRELLALVAQCVARVSDEWGNELRCHELARAVHVVTYEHGYTLVVVDGTCGSIEHSWLMLDGGRILDPYAPGRLPAVQLVDPIVGSYQPGEKRTDIRRAIVDQLVIEMRGDQS